MPKSPVGCRMAPHSHCCIIMWGIATDWADNEMFILNVKLMHPILFLNPANPMVSNGKFQQPKMNAMNGVQSSEGRGADAKLLCQCYVTSADGGAPTSTFVLALEHSGQC